MALSPTQKRAQAARVTLVLDQPFFGVLALHLTAVDDPTCQTAWTDGRTLGFNPAFVATLSDPELTAVVAHEVMHCACGHPWRRDAREPHRWNVAADYAINHVIQQAGFTLPADALIEAQYAGRSAEWIYDRLPPQKSGGDDGDPQGDGMGGVRDAPANAPSTAGDDSDDSGDGQSPTTGPTQADWQQLTQQAARMAKGTLPADLRRDLLALSKPVVDWRSVLRRFVQEVTRSDYTWTRPNVRYLASGLYLPSLHARSCGHLAVAIDTSGSIDSVLLSQFASEVQAIVSEVQPSRVTIVYCDARVNHVDTYEQGETPEIVAHGGGGTAFGPVFEHFASVDDPPVALVYLTDLYGSFPGAAPDYPVIWAVNSRATDAPFGEVVPCA